MGIDRQFQRPERRRLLRGLYPFNEDFNGANGQQRRLAEFGNQSIKTAEGHWLPLTTARFTHTSDGYKDRLYRGAGVSHGRFILERRVRRRPPVRYGDEYPIMPDRRQHPDVRLARP